MAIDFERLSVLAIPDTVHSYTEPDAILYALGVGFGFDPLDPAQLDFVTEARLRPAPTFGVVLAQPGFWMRELDTGIDWLRAVHGEQGLVIHQAPPTSGTVIGRERIVDVIDKGIGRGALVLTEREVFDAASGVLLVTATQTAFCRGDGGFGGPARPRANPHPIPARPPDIICDLPTHPQQALIYRLSGDRNPLHAEPGVGRAAGYPQPILHGLASYGVAGHAILRGVANYDTSRIAALSARFTAPVYPGETLRTAMWCDGSIVSFQTSVVGRDVIAIGNGKAVLRN